MIRTCDLAQTPQLKIRRGKITWMQKEHFLMVKN